jgi:hypothetical protein
VKLKNILKDLVYPITLLTIVTFLGILVSIHALYVAVTIDPLYAVIVIPITVFLIVLYILDRFLIKRVAYATLMLGEVLLGIVVFLLFSYQESYTDVNFNTDQDHILVIFDAQENSISTFNRKGIFGKELNVDSNTIHLDRSMALRKNLRINDPESWKGSYYKHGKYDFKGDSIEYIFSLHQKSIGPDFIRSTDRFIDSLLQEEIK